MENSQMTIILCLFTVISVSMYTCFAVSSSFIALAANTGFINIFNRKSHKQVQAVLPEKNLGGVTIVKFAPDDRYIGYATTEGNVVLVDLNTNHMSKPERVRLSQEHVGHTVTYLRWDKTSSRLFSGDDIGWVTATVLSHNKIIKGMEFFNQQTCVILKLDSSVVQIDCSQEKLLVSTLTRSYLCHTSRQQYTQIGKNLRDGAYGNCFFHCQSSPSPIIYCTRPGSRLWEVNFEGTVMSTRHLKDQLSVPSFPIITKSGSEWVLPDYSHHVPAQPANFPVLLQLNPEFICTWNQRGVFVLNPQTGQLITWCDQLKGATDISCVRNELFVFYEDARNLKQLSLVSLEECVSALIRSQNWESACRVSCRFDDFLGPQKIISSESWGDLVNAVNNDPHLHEYCDKVVDLYGRVKDRDARIGKTQTRIREHKLGSKDHKIVIVNGGEVNDYEMKTMERLDVAESGSSGTSPRSVSCASPTGLVAYRSTQFNNSNSPNVPLNIGDHVLNTGHMICSITHDRPASVSERSSPVKITAPVRPASVASGQRGSYETLRTESSIDDVSLFSPGFIEQFSMASLIDGLSIVKQKVDPLTQGDQPGQPNRLAKFIENIGKAVSGSRESLASEASSDLATDAPRTLPVLNNAPRSTLGDNVDRASVVSDTLPEVPPPPIRLWDYEPMMALTQSVNRLIRDYKIAFDKNAIVDSLTAWLGHLHSAVDGFCDAVSKDRRCFCEGSCRWFNDGSGHGEDVIGADVIGAIDDDGLDAVTDVRSRVSGHSHDPAVSDFQNRQSNNVVDSSFNEVEYSSQSTGFPEPVKFITDGLNKTNDRDETPIDTCSCRCATHGVKLQQYSSSHARRFRNPLPMPADLHRLVCELLLLCFQLQIHADVSRSFHVDVSRRTAVRTAPVNSDVVHLDPSSPSVWSEVDLNDETSGSWPDERGAPGSGLNTPPVLPDAGGYAADSGSTGEIRDDDEQMAFMLWVYYDWLSAVDVERIVLSWNRECYETWTTLLLCLRDCEVNDKAVDSVTDSKVSRQSHVLRDLAKSFTMSPGDAIDLCVENACHAHPLHILYLCRLHTRLPQGWLVHYVSKMTPAQTARHGWVENVEIQRVLAEAVLSAAGVQQAQDSQGGLVVGVTEVTVPEHKRILSTVLDYVGTNTSQIHPILDICVKYGYMPGCIQLLNALNRRHTLLGVLVNTGDVSALKQESAAPRTFAEWETVIQLMTQGHSTGVSDVSSHDTPLTSQWDQVTQLLVQSVGVDDAVSTLIASPPSHPPSTALCASLVAAAVIKHRQRHVLHNMLDKVNTYFWMKKPAESPLKRLEGDGKGGLRSCGVEEPAAHWGVSTQLNLDCVGCGLDISSVVSVTAPNILVCHCGASYHKSCLSQLGGCLHCS